MPSPKKHEIKLIFFKKLKKCKYEDWILIILNSRNKLNAVAITIFKYNSLFVRVPNFKLNDSIKKFFLNKIFLKL